ncbi:3374_t:CDS:2, partial [Funneliformis caledonium]
MSQLNRVGLELNGKNNFETCLDCGKEQSNFGWCQECEINAFKANFKYWTSGNLEIDNFIRHTQLNASGSVDYLEYLDFEQFDLVENTNKRGAFSEIYSAIWLEGPRCIWDEGSEQWTRSGPIKIALKRLNNSQNMCKEYLNQLYKYHKCLQSGDLHTYLDEAQGSLSWREIVEMLWEISGGIDWITAICDEPVQSELSDQFDIAEEKKFSDLEKF